MGTVGGELYEVDSSSLARRALLTAAILAVVGSGLGVVAIARGTVAPGEILLILSGLVFSAAVLVTLLVFRSVALQTVATLSMAYFGAYLCLGVIFSVSGDGLHMNFFVYLMWFFPLLVFNKLVNAPAVGRFFAKALLIAPLLILVCLIPRLFTIFRPEVLFPVGAWCLSYLSFVLMFGTVTRYREEFLVARERAEALKVESSVLESISDCFVSLDSLGRFVYLNDAACAELGVERSVTLNDTLASAVPGFLSPSMQAGLQAAAGMFEAQDQSGDRWYEVRCFPRPDGLSIYFRNITESMLSRHRLEEAHRVVREQAELLDKAQDAILVQSMENRVLYWNKSAERLYGWTAGEVIGRSIEDIFHGSLAETKKGVAHVLERGEWGGELSQRRRDGSPLIVESRCTLVCGDDGSPKSILAIHTDITDRKTAEAKIERLAFHDLLTGLANRMLLRQRLEQALSPADGPKNNGALLFIDLDDFKTLNDTLGHDTGDLLLQQVALRLTSCVRKTDTVARLGGDEFVVMLTGLSEAYETAAAEAKAVGDAIRSVFVQPFQIGNFEYNSTGSIGITMFEGCSDTSDNLLKRADLAMYRAKAQGRNATCFYDPAMQTLVASRAALQADLRRALQNDGFELHYQPQVDRDGKTIGAEALVRWSHPLRGQVPPSEFIPVAEEGGLIVELGRWVLETACAQLAVWANLPELEDLTIAVNVSVRQFLDVHFVSLVRNVLRESGANPRRLKLEITESSVMERVEDTIAKMNAIRALGVTFSMDDFGTGYSSLSHLKRLPIDQLKIDRSFVTDVLSNIRDASVARTIIALARNLNLSVIAEGVETEGQRQFLEKEGCHTYQGYLFSAALTAEQFQIFATAGQAAQYRVA